MPAWSKALAAVVVNGGVVTAINFYSPGASAQTDVLELSFDEPVTQCFHRADPRAEALRDGSVRPVLVVHAFQPGTEGSGGVRAMSLATDQSIRIGFFPGGAFRADGPETMRRYALPETADVHEDGLCYELTLLGGTGARAEVGLDVSEPIDR